MWFSIVAEYSENQADKYLSEIKLAGFLSDHEEAAVFFDPTPCN
jgi:hypothetical protein